MTASLAAFIFFAVFITSLLSGTLGMAGGMVLMGMLTSVLPIPQTMMLHAVSQFCANGGRALILREHIRFAGVGYYLAGMAISFAFFCLVAFVPNKMTVFLLLGIGPFLPLLLRNKIQFDFTKPRQAFFCGASVTGFQLTSGVAGPLIDLFFQKTGLTRHQVIATKSFTQLIAHIAKFSYFGMLVPMLTHTPAPELLPIWVYLAIVPVSLLGSRAGHHLLNRISDQQFFQMTQWLLWVMGAFYLGKAAFLAYAN